MDRDSKQRGERQRHRPLHGAIFRQRHCHGPGQCQRHYGHRRRDGGRPPSRADQPHGEGLEQQQDRPFLDRRRGCDQLLGHGSLDGKSWTQVGTTASGATSFTDTGLASSTTYYYCIIAVDSGGDSPASNIASATTLKKGK